MTKSLYIVALEPLDTRYTKQWFEEIPKSFKQYAQEHLVNIEVVTIAGDIKADANVTKGAFLDFAGTNEWKSQQLQQIAQLFGEGKIQAGDIFLYTDFWNPTVIQLKYMSELLDIPVKIFGVCHAGSYDIFDLIGQKVGDQPWVRSAEKSMAECYDHLFFATDFHLQLFEQAFYSMPQNPKLVRAGFPMDYLPNLLHRYNQLASQRKNMIAFPHRKSPEKQLDIFLDLAQSLPEYDWVVCQDAKLTKETYHTILGSAKMVFSANLQETLGIGTCIEAPLLGAIPLAPDRLSYSEIFANHREFLYPGEWTTDFDTYKDRKESLVYKIHDIMNSYETLRPSLDEFCEMTLPKYIQPKKMFSYILG